MRKLLTMVIVGAMVLGAGCTMTDRGTDLNGMTNMDGEDVVHQSTTNVALHFLFSKPVINDGRLQKTVADFTADATEYGASEVRIVQSSKSTYWYVMPPISFIVQPVVTNVAGDIDRQE
ncbi:MAG: hypothetical protein ACOC2T_02770 [Planctomycetota bacterium]